MVPQERVNPLSDEQERLCLQVWHLWREFVSALKATGVTVTEDLLEVRRGQAVKLEGTFYAEVAK